MWGTVPLKTFSQESAGPGFGVVQRFRSHNAHQVGLGHDLSRHLLSYWSLNGT